MDSHYLKFDLWARGGKAFAVGALLLLAAACETTGVDDGDRYARAYDACDSRAGVCYARCDDYSLSEGRRECQSDCSFAADQCFGDVSRRTELDSTYSTTRDTFYGRYGAWYPTGGYRFGPHGRRFSYAPWRDPYFRSGYGYGYSDRSRNRNRDQYVDRDKDDDGRDDRTGGYVPYDYVEGADRVTPRGRGFTSTAPRSTGKPDTRLPKVPRGPAKPKARPAPAPKGDAKPNSPPKGTSRPAVPNRPTPKPSSSRPKPVKKSAPKPAASKPAASKPAAKPPAKPARPRKTAPRAKPGKPQKELD